LRIKIWLFSIEFDTALKDLNHQIETLKEAFNIIRKDELFLKILGAILKVGNCLNAGNKQRGQADGFQIDALSKTTTLKDINGESVLKLIVTTISEENPEISEIKNRTLSC